MENMMLNMKLNKKMAIGVCVILLIVFSGALSFSFQNERSYVIEQLQRNTQVTASILSNLLGSSEVGSDKNNLENMLQTVADKRDLSDIVIRDAQGNTQLDVHAKADKAVKSGFLAHLALIPPSVATTPIMRNGQQQGSVVITANPYTAIESLWSYGLNLLLWYLASVVIAMVMVWVFVRELLKPLPRVTAQARALMNDEYNLQNLLPKTPEFRELTLAMNQMVRRLRGIFQEQSRRVELLRQQAFQDPLTSLGNRRFFLHQMTALLADAEEFIPSYLFFVAIDGLRELNETEGYVQGDKTILEVPLAIAEIAAPFPISCMARVGGSQFGILVRASDIEKLASYARELQQNLASRLQKIGDCKPFIGGAPCRFLQPMESLLRDADTALNKARECSEAVHVAQNNEGAPSPEMLESLLSNGQLALYWQKITNTQRVLHRKIFARLIGTDGEEVSAGMLLPIAEQLGLAWKIDCMILKRLEQADPDLLEPFALSLSSNTIIDLDAQNKYIQQMSRTPAALRRLIRVEFPENLVVKYPEAVRKSIEALRKLGVGSGIDQAGIHFGNMDYLEDFHILYVKLHGSLSKDIVDNESKQVFIQHFVGMANTLEIQVIATQVEDEGQWLLLQSAGITWGQGRYFGGLEPVSQLKLPEVA
jgi:diguanylate cyclase (GGDEF)-like protein